MSRKVQNILLFVITFSAFLSCNKQSEFDDNLYEYNVRFNAVDSNNQKLDYYLMYLYKDSDAYLNDLPFKTIYIKDSLVLKKESLTDTFYCQSVKYDYSTNKLKYSNLEHVILPDYTNVSHIERNVNFKCKNECYPKLCIANFECKYEYGSDLDVIDDPTNYYADLYIVIQNEYMSDLSYGIDIKTGSVVPINYVVKDWSNPVLFYDFDFNYSADELLVKTNLNVNNFKINDTGYYVDVYVESEWGTYYQFGILNVRWSIEK